MKLIQVVCCLVLSWGCSGAPAVELAADGDAVSPEPVAPDFGAAAGGPSPTRRPYSIECVPAELVAGDTLLIRLSHPRGPYLAVEAPDGTLFFLAYPTYGDPTSPPAWIAERVLAGASEVRLPTGSVRVSPWQSAAVRPELVFAREGVYRIVVSENLETDMEDVPQASCEIRLVGRP